MELFIRLDEDFAADPKIRRLSRALGRVAVLDYIELLPIFRRFPETGFQIPYSELRDIAEHDLFTDPKSLRKTVKECVAIGLYEEDGKTFWSPRRKADLLSQADLRAKQQEAARRTNEKRKEKATTVGHDAVPDGIAFTVPNGGLLRR